MTDKEVKEKAITLINGKNFVKIEAIWDYKPTYMKRGCLVRRSGGVGVAMPNIPIKYGQEPEYQAALKIIKLVEKLKHNNS
jgi:hypothetical protein